MSRFARVWYRGLLLFYTSDFRRRLGAELLRVLDEQHANVSTLSRGKRWLSHCGASYDVVVAGIRERVAAGSIMVRVIGMLFVAAALMQVIYDLATPSLSMGVLAWGVTLIVCSLGVRLIRAGTPISR